MASDGRPSSMRCALPIPARGMGLHLSSGRRRGDDERFAQWVHVQQPRVESGLSRTLSGDPPLHRRHELAEALRDPSDRVSDVRVLWRI